MKKKEKVRNALERWSPRRNPDQETSDHENSIVTAEEVATGAAINKSTLDQITLLLKKLSTEIKVELNLLAPVYGTVYNWADEFKRGGATSKNESRSERPVEMTAH